MVFMILDDGIKNILFNTRYFGKYGRWAANKRLICLRSNEFDIVANVICDLD